MKYAEHISPEQQRFIRWLRDGHMTAEDLAAKQKEDPKRLSRWFRNPYFWKNVREATRVSLRRSWLKNKLAAIEADEAMAGGVKDGKGLLPDHLATCDKVKEHARADERLAMSRRRARQRKGKPKIDRNRDLVHPDFKHQEEELLAALEKDHAAGC